MPSIFVWKSVEQNTSKDSVRYYSGSNWFLEDVDGVSRSFLLQDQEVVLDSVLGDKVIIFDAKEMNKDWVGTELLEVTQLPYKHIKSDELGSLVMIGDWFRFTLNKGRMTVEELHRWITEDQSSKKEALDYNNFLIKYDNTAHLKRSTQFHKKAYMGYRGHKGAKSQYSS
jgi:hypothetical protein